MKNANSMPQRYFGLHMVAGVAEYADPKSGERYRILLNEATLKEMDPTYEGKPVYVRHVEDVDLANLQNEADGYVVKSFYNELDGKHWVEFLVVSDKGHEAIRKGWRLSNSYKPSGLGNGGEWHAVEYRNEITSGEYNHLAIVPSPRYEESVVFTPDQFKAYNEEKKQQLASLKNAKGDPAMFDFFKKAKAENPKDYESMSVVLPKSKKEISITHLINEADELAIKKDEGMADPAGKVKLFDGALCNVEELIKRHGDLSTEHAALKTKYDAMVEKFGDPDAEEKKDDQVTDPPEGEGAEDGKDKGAMTPPEKEEETAVAPGEDEDVKKKALEIAEHEEKEMAGADKKNATDLKAFTLKVLAAIRKPAAKSADELEKIKNSKEKADKLRNAEHLAGTQAVTLMTGQDKVEKGKAKYGS